MSLFNVGGYTINAKMVEYVTPIGGDPAYERYTVKFRSGSEMSIFTTRRDGITMARDEFINMWQQALEKSDGVYNSRC